jgi:hypothetical protein
VPRPMPGGASSARPTAAHGEPPVAAPAAPVSAGRARSKFHEACRRDDPHAARRALLAWVAAAWPNSTNTGLHGLAKQFADPAVAAALADLERACFAGGAWDGARLAAAFPELPKPARAGSGDSPIAPLYR